MSVEYTPNPRPSNCITDKERLEKRQTYIVNDEPCIYLDYLREGIFINLATGTYFHAEFAVRDYVVVRADFKLICIEEGDTNEK